MKGEKQLKFYEVIDKNGKVVFRGYQTTLLEQFHITWDSFQRAKRDGNLWGMEIREIERTDKPIDYNPFPKKKGKREPKKVIHRTSSSVWYTYE